MMRVRFSYQPDDMSPTQNVEYGGMESVPRVGEPVYLEDGYPREVRSVSWHFDERGLDFVFVSLRGAPRKSEAAT